MKRFRHHGLLQAVGYVMGLVLVLVVVQMAFQAAQGRSQPLARWAISFLERLLTPLSQWFLHAPTWGYIAMIMVVNVPAAMLMTWAVHVSGMGIKPRHRPRWLIAIWLLLVVVQVFAIRWVRRGGGGI